MEEETLRNDPPYDAPAFPTAPLPTAPLPTAQLPTAPTAPLPPLPSAAAPLPLPSSSFREPLMERMTERVVERVPERVPMVERVVDRVDHMKGETLTMTNPSRIFPYIMAQESTHFQFKTKEMERRFQQMIEQIPDLTVRFDYGKEDKSDILLVSSSDPTQIVGKLHLLLVDRRDRGDPSKRYVKIHLFHMKDPQQFELVRQRVTDFFEKIGPSTRTSTTRMPMTESQKKRVQHRRRRVISLTRKRPAAIRGMKRSIKRSSIKRSMTRNMKRSIKRSTKRSTKPSRS